MQPSPRESSFCVSVQDASNGRGTGAYGLGLITLPSTNALQEFRVASGALNAEYRSTTGITTGAQAGHQQLPRRSLCGMLSLAQNVARSVRSSTSQDPTSDNPRDSHFRGLRLNRTS